MRTAMQANLTTRVLGTGLDWIAGAVQGQSRAEAGTGESYTTRYKLGR